MTAWFTEVTPETMTPSTGMVSPGRTRRRSPTCTLSAGIVSSPELFMRRAVCGVSCTSFSMPARAFATVRSSSSAPSCIMKATSPAAKSSPMITEAMSAIETSTSALMSKAVTSPMTASSTIGTPQRMMATQAASKGRPGASSKMLTSSEAAPRMRNATSFFTPPHSSRASSFSICIRLSYTYRGIGII